MLSRVATIPFEAEALGSVHGFGVTDDRVARRFALHLAAYHQTKIESPFTQDNKVLLRAANLLMHYVWDLGSTRGRPDSAELNDTERKMFLDHVDKVYNGTFLQGLHQCDGDLLDDGPMQLRGGCDDEQTSPNAMEVCDGRGVGDGDAHDLVKRLLDKMEELHPKVIKDIDSRLATRQSLEHGIEDILADAKDETKKCNICREIVDVNLDGLEVEEGIQFDVSDVIGKLRFDAFLKWNNEGVHLDGISYEALYDAILVDLLSSAWKLALKLSGTRAIEDLTSQLANRGGYMIFGFTNNQRQNTAPRPFACFVYQTFGELVRRLVEFIAFLRKDYECDPTLRRDRGAYHKATESHVKKFFMDNIASNAEHSSADTTSNCDGDEDSDEEMEDAVDASGKPAGGAASADSHSPSPDAGAAAGLRSIAEAKAYEEVCLAKPSSDEVLDELLDELGPSAVVKDGELLMTDPEKWTTFYNSSCFAIKFSEHMHQ